MKKTAILSVAVIVLSGCMAAFGQGLDPQVPGDQFSLEGALELFKKSKSPEEFEKMLNSADAKVNNLDLNGDGYIDYIRVLDHNEGHIHAFVLQAVVSESEYQDIAVIELEKLANGKAVLQITGDEDVYGVETIIEPTTEVRTYAGATSSRSVVNVWAWPSVQYVYGPSYVVWVSPWGWYRRPVWWRTWRPVAYYDYYPVWRPYRPYYAVCHTHRVVYANRIYRPYRRTSLIVYNRHHDQVDRYRSARRDDYRNGRSASDEGRRYDRNNRSSGGNASPQRRADFDHNRKTSIQRDEATSSNRPVRERTTSPDAQRHSADRSGNADLNRRRVTAPNNHELRPRVTTPAENRRTESPNVQRPAPRVHPMPSEVQRNSSVQRRAEMPARRTANVPASRATHPQVNKPSVNRSSASHVPAARQRSSERTGDARSSGNRRGRD